MEEIKIIDPCKDPRWDAFVETHPFGWIVHLSGWKKVLESTFPHINGHYLTLIDPETNEIKAGLPIYEIHSWLTGNRLVSIPYATLSNPLISDKQQGEALIAAAIKLLDQRKLSYIEIRTLNNNFLQSNETLRSNNDYRNHYLTLSVGEQALWNNLSYKSIRYMINKANKNELKIKIASGEKDVQIFYRLYASTRKRLGLPAQPYLFFKKLFDIFSLSGHVRITLAAYKDNIIAGHFLFRFNGRVSAEVVGEDMNYRNLSPNHFLFWEEIKSACAEGYDIYDFGRTSVHNNTLMDFKKRWGTTEAALDTFYYDHGENRIGTTSRETSTSYRLMRYMCNKSPGPIQPILSRFCYRHLG